MDELRKERLNLSQMISAELCCILPVYKLFSLLESWFPSYLSREEFCPSMSRRLDDVMVCRVTLCELHHSESSLLKEYSFVFKLPSFCLHLSSNMLVTCSTKKWLRYHLMWTTPPPPKDLQLLLQIVLSFLREMWRSRKEWCTVKLYRVVRGRGEKGCI